MDYCVGIVRRYDIECYNLRLLLCTKMNLFLKDTLPRFSYFST